MENAYQKTVYACYAAYIVQAVVNNFAPLLFVHFQSEFGLPLGQITMLVTFNFSIQLLLDLCSVSFIDRIGYRKSMLIANFLCTTGLCLLTVLPNFMPNAFAGLLLSVMVYAVGGGLLEVLVSPIVEACPTKNKEAVMSLLHSFYCWGQAAVVLISTAFFSAFGVGRWRILALLWALLPLGDLIAFTRVPVASLIEDGERGKTFRELAFTGIFWVFFLMMICAGASEQAVSQWASAFAETGLGVTKTVGDLLGPMFFAIMMGLSRAWFGKAGSRLDLKKYMGVSALLCIAAYLLIGFAPSPSIGLLGCGLTGFSVGIFWPGTFSLASEGIRNGGTLMFALFALAGDIGCSAGPTLAGVIASAAGSSLSRGILACILFPVGMAVLIRFIRTGRAEA
jgi:fucose permease